LIFVTIIQDTKNFISQYKSLIGYKTIQYNEFYKENNLVYEGIIDYILILEK